MTKQEIAQQISKKTGYPIHEVMTVVEGFTEALIESFGRGENVYLRGFGTFGIVTRKEKIARNIKAGTTVNVPAHNIVKFKLSNQVNIKQ